MVIRGERGDFDSWRGAFNTHEDGWPALPLMMRARP
jgi:hypothetical protein